MEHTIGIALVGLGEIAQHHLAGIVANKNLQLVAVCDINEKVKHQWLGDVPFFDTVEALLEATQSTVDYVIIATPPHTHRQIAQPVLAYGKVPLVEKPLAPAWEAIGNFVSKNDNEEDTTYVIYHWQYAPETLCLKKFLKDKGDEPIRRIVIDIRDPYVNAGKIIEQHKSKGDAWTDSGVNALSFVSALLDNDLSKAEEIRLEHLRYVDNKPVESTCRFTVGQTKVFIHVKWGRAKKKTSLVCTTRHRYHINHMRQRVTELKSGLFPVRHECGDANRRLDEHYINFYQSSDWQTGRTNLPLAYSLHRILHQSANTYWQRLRVQHNLRRRNRLHGIADGLPLMLSVTLLVLFFLYIYWEKVPSLSFSSLFGLSAKHGFRLMDFFVNALAALFGVIGTFVIYHFIRRVRRQNEDDLKVEYNDFVLYQQYGEHYYQEGMLNDCPFTVYHEPIFTREQADKVVIEDHPADKFRLDNFIRFQYFSIRSAHSGNSFKNEQTIRLRDVIRKEDGSIVFQTERANYLAHMLTNRAVDYKMNGVASLRQLFEYSATLTPLKDSLFANHLGVNALILIENDRYILLPQRTRNATISKQMLTATIATRLKVNDYSQSISTDTIKTIDDRTVIGAMAINWDEWEMFRQTHPSIKIETQLIGGGRDIYEGGKPTFFYLVHIPQLTLQEYLAFSYQHRTHFDEVAHIFVLESNRLTLRDNIIRFTRAYIKNKKGSRYTQRTHFIKPEKNLLSLLWHYSTLPSNR